MAFVKTIPYDESDGELRAVYDWMIQTRGRASNVMSVNSLRPGIIKTLAAHVENLMRGDSKLPRAEREMIAAVVSATNKCQY